MVLAGELGRAELRRSQTDQHLWTDRLVYNIRACNLINLLGTRNNDAVPELNEASQSSYAAYPSCLLMSWHTCGLQP